VIAWLAAILAAPALAADELLDEEEEAQAAEILVQPARERERVRFRMVPLRMDSRVAIRDGFQPAAVFELGAQALRTRRLQLDVNAALVPVHPMLLPGPWRTFWATEVSGDGLFTASRWLAVGPTGGLSVRLYEQQGADLGAQYVPFAGMRAHTTLLRARRWSVAASTRLASDLVLTRFVIDTQQVLTMSPVEAQVGLRVLFGHGRVPEPKEAS